MQESHYSRRQFLARAATGGAGVGIVAAAADAFRLRPPLLMAAEMARRTGGGRQLFLDDEGIERMNGLRRVVNSAVRYPKNPVLRRAHPWEQFRVMVSTVLYDEDDRCFKMWYNAIPHNNTQPAVKIDGKNRIPYCTLIAYATSRDGVEWERPVLGQLDFNGDGKRNNLVAVGRENTEGFSVIKDAAERDPQRRYKAFFWEHRTAKSDYYGVPPYNNPPGGDWGEGMWVAFSPDGVHWKNHGRVFPDASDTHNMLIWDPQTRQFSCFSRLGGVGRRVSRIQSDDLLNWSKPELVFQADGKDPLGTQIYGMTVSLVDGTYVGFPQLFYHNTTGRIEIGLAFSRDGRRWQRPSDRTPITPLSRPDAWDAGDIRMGSSVVLKDDKVYLFYSAAHGPHPVGDVGKVVETYTHEYHQKYRSMEIGLATIRRDGWVSFDAGQQPGTLVTKPVTLPKGTLHLNADASCGEVRVALIDESGKVLAEPEPVRGNQLRGKVALAGDVPKPGTPVRLRFTVRDAKLYSYWFEQRGDSK